MTPMRPRRLPLPGLLALLACLLCAPLRADVFFPAYLQIEETAAQRWDIGWRVPLAGERRLALQARLPTGLDAVVEDTPLLVDGYYLQRWTASGALPGKAIAFEGLRGGVTDIIVRLRYASGAERVERIDAAQQRFIVPAPETAGRVAVTYFVLGVEHILLGLDHLLFVLALLLLVRGWGRILATITAFTVAHSLTLGPAALGWLRLPIAPVEALIALSIVFVAAEVIHGLRGRPGLTARAPWLVAFGFGLLHGLGFASALAHIGLPERSVALALLLFNLGVEAGQILFVAAVLLLYLPLRRLPVRLAGAEGAAAHALGLVAAYWFAERLVTGVLALPL